MRLAQLIPNFWLMTEEQQSSYLGTYRLKRNEELIKSLEFRKKKKSSTSSGTRKTWAQLQKDFNIDPDLIQIMKASGLKVAEAYQRLKEKLNGQRES